MLKTVYVLKNKNRYEKEEKRRRLQELTDLRQEGILRVALNRDLNVLRTMLLDSEVDYVDIEVDEKHLAYIHKALYFEEMQEFEWRQGRTPTLFRFKRKEISL